MADTPKSDGEEDLSPLLSRVSVGFRATRADEADTPAADAPAPEPAPEPAASPRPTQPGEHAPNLAIELGPRMSDLVRRTPLDDTAKEQIETAIANPEVAEIRKPVVAVALMNCLDRRVAEMEAVIDQLKSLRAEVEKAGKGI